MCRVPPSVLHSRPREVRRCRRARGPWLVSMATGALVEPACRAWTCPDCGPRRARRLGLALDRAGYDRWLTVTKPPSDLRQGVARLAYELRKLSAMEWAWSSERGDQGALHVHAVVRGWIDHRREGDDSPLDTACRQAGFGLCSWIERATGQAASYTAKCASYASKGGRDATTYMAWLAFNGGKRPWHWSRGYTGGVPMRRWVTAQFPQTDPGPWIPTSAPDRHRV